MTPSALTDFTTDLAVGRRARVAPGATTISIHVYGADIERRGTSIYRRFDDWPVRRRPAVPLAA